jgi:uncharacterized protein YjbI with pentapeptide repeats
MQSIIINKDNFAATQWDDNYFKHCEFVNFSKEGEVIGSDFIGCSFKNVDWYWGIFTQANFIKCHFIDCVFRGTSFVDARFIECKMDNCLFIKDSLGADCDFSRAVAYGCTINGGEGFRAEVRT